MNKYKNVKTRTSDGVLHDSSLEAQRWCELKLLERSGKIKNLKRQVEYELIPAQYESYERWGKNGKRLQELYGITDERMDSWRRNEQGYEVPTSEEDPDTLSYGVYLMWGTFFLPRANGKK